MRYLIFGNYKKRASGGEVSHLESWFANAPGLRPFTFADGLRP